MENELIKITTNEKGQQCVSARELHGGLKVQQDFSDWIKKQLNSVDAIEDADFTLYWYKTNDPFKKVVEFNGNVNSMVRRGYESDYVLTVDIAKEICMVVGVSPRTNEETKALSKQFRKYFIECEKKLKEVDIKGQLLLAIYNGGQEGIVASKQLVELEKKPLLDKIEEQTPKANYYDKVLEPKDEENGFTKLITTTDIAKDLGMTARKLNEILNFRGVIYKQGKVWKVYAEYDFLITEKYCDYHITEYSQTLKWTEKGREWIINLLNN